MERPSEQQRQAVLRPVHHPPQSPPPSVRSFWDGEGKVMLRKDGRRENDWRREKSDRWSGGSC